jgi:hypothetical protein
LKDTADATLRAAGMMRLAAEGAQEWNGDRSVLRNRITRVLRPDAHWNSAAKQTIEAITRSSRGWRRYRIDWCRRIGLR